MEFSSVLSAFGASAIGRHSLWKPLKGTQERKMGRGRKRFLEFLLIEGMESLFFI